LSDYTKDQVYKLAKKWKLPFRQGESFDLCFVVRDAESFLKKYLKMKPGKIVNLTHPTPLFKKEREPREILGKHGGLALYTIGQRKNIPLSRGPWWVVKKDRRNNILYVSNNEKDLYSRELTAGNLNWVSGQAKLPQKVLAKIRYKSEASPAVIYGIVCLREISRRQTTFHRDDVGTRNDTVRVIFGKPQRAMTPGQSVVFYSKKGEVLGGGVIE